MSGLKNGQSAWLVASQWKHFWINDLNFYLIFHHFLLLSKFTANCCLQIHQKTLVELKLVFYTIFKWSVRMSKRKIGQKMKYQACKKCCTFFHLILIMDCIPVSFQKLYSIFFTFWKRNSYLFIFQFFNSSNLKKSW